MRKTRLGNSSVASGAGFEDSHAEREPGKDIPGLVSCHWGRKYQAAPAVSQVHALRLMPYCRYAFMQHKKCIQP